MREIKVSERLQEIEDRAGRLWDSYNLESKMNWLQMCNLGEDEYYTKWSDLTPDVKHTLALEYDDATQSKYAEFYNPEDEEELR